jgi:diacylglycerol kinase
MSVGASGVLNWAQLQGYRPLMMNSINGASVVGSVSFMSTLGSTAAYAVFTVLAQFQVPQQYSSQGASTARYLQLLAFVTLLLCMACLPVGAAFLWLTTKMQLLALVYLVAVGVLIEAGNSAIGACINHMNALDQRMWGLPFSGLLGCAVAFGLLVAPWPTQDPHLRVALALVAGQIVAVVTVLYLTYRTVKS